MSTFNPYNRVARYNGRTHEGGAGFKPSREEELALIVLGTFFTDSFYESSFDTAKRMYNLVQGVSMDYIEKLAVVARQDFNMRSTPAVLLGMATLVYGQPSQDIAKRVFTRGDELGDYLGAVALFSNNGKVIPSAVRFARKVLHRTLDERTALRYGGGNKKWNLPKILRLTHARQGANFTQHALMNFILKRHETGSMTDAWDSLNDAQRKLLPLVDAAVHNRDAGDVSWERSRSTGNASWNELAPKMGYMALLRNLRNFAGDATFTGMSDVLRRISDPEAVANSKQMPFRYLSAINATSNTGGFGMEKALREALDHSLANLPEFTGKTLVLVDTSGSMDSVVGGTGSETSAVDIAALFGASLSRMGDTRVVAFGTRSQVINFSPTDDVYGRYQQIVDHGLRRRLGYGTEINSALDSARVSDYDNLIILSDMQVADYMDREYRDFKGVVISVDLAPYEHGIERIGNSFFAFAGWSDAVLNLMSTLTRNKNIVDYVKNAPY